MNIVSRNKSTHRDQTRRHRPVRWFSLLMGVAVLAVTGSVVADVIITFELSTSVTNTLTGPFAWDQGSNYGAAAALGVLTSTCASGTLGTLGAPAGCFHLSTVVNGYLSEGVTVLNGYSFDEYAAGGSFTIDSTALAMTSLVFTGPLTCALMIVSDAPVARGPGGSGSYDFSVNPTNCAVTFTPAVGVETALNSGCPAASGSTPGIIAFDMTGVLAPQTLDTLKCVTPATGAAAPTLDISFVIYTGGTTVATTTAANLLVSPY